MWPCPASSSLKTRNLLLCWGKNLLLLLFLRDILSSFSYNLKILIPKKYRCVFNSHKSPFFSLSLTSSSHHLNFGWDPARALRLGCKWNVAPHTSSKVLFVPWVIPGCAQSSHRAPSLGSPQLLPYGKGRYCCCTRVICNSVFSSSSTAVIVQL